MIRVTMNMLTLDDEAVIPTANTENIKKKSQKLSVNELAQKPIDIIRDPLMAVILNPKRLIRRVANDPKI